MSHRREFMKTVGISTLLASTATAETINRPNDINPVRRGEPYLVLVGLQCYPRMTNLQSYISYTLVRAKMGDDLVIEATKRARELHPILEVVGVYPAPIVVHFQSGYKDGIDRIIPVTRFYCLKLDREVHGTDTHYAVARNVEAAIEALTVKATVQGIEKMGFWVDSDD